MKNSATLHGHRLLKKAISKSLHVTLKTPLVASEGNIMRKNNFQLGNVVVLWALLTTPAFAGGFQADILCDPPPGHGKGKISGKGTGHFHMQELPPNATFTCVVDCVVSEDSSAQSCISNSRGRLTATFDKVPAVCLGAVLLIKQDTTILCGSGFVSEIPIIPHP